MKLKGNVFVFGDNIDTDVIIPARCLVTSEPTELAKHCMEDLDKDFAKNVKAGDIIVAGKNFGCGSSREHAPIALKASGVACIIAESFARIFYRNAINIGLPILECKMCNSVKSGEIIGVDLKEGKIETESGKNFTAKPFPEFVLKIIANGGLLNS